VFPLCRAAVRDHQLPGHAERDVAVLAPGRDWVDRARAAVDRAGVLQAGAIPARSMAPLCFSQSRGRTSRSMSWTTSCWPCCRRSFS
jgi:hypothetical protein